MPGFALTYVGSLPTSDRRQSDLGRDLRAAAKAVAIQLAVGAVIGLVAIVFVEDLHSEDDSTSTTTSTSAPP